MASAKEDDSILLDRFLSALDESAFAELVRRHGPMVLGVCRRALGNSADADDAFQATFLVLARNPRSIRKGRSLASWLFGVARFTALRARDKAHRQRVHEARAAREPQPTSDADPELLLAVDEELHRLPEEYRAALVACLLQGRTQEDAAREAGCSLSTLRRRLERARELLRARLTGRGVAPAIGAMGVGVGAAQLSAATAEAAARVAAAYVDGKAKAVPATALAEAVMATMSRTKLKALVTSLLLVAGLAGAGVTWQLAFAQPPRPDPSVQPTRAAAPLGQPPGAPARGKDLPPKSAGEKPGEDRIKPGDRLLVRVRNVSPTAPIDGPFDVEASGKIHLGVEYGRVKVGGMTFEEAEAAIVKHLVQSAGLRKPVAAVTRYTSPADRALELRVEQLELEVKRLRLLVEELRKQKR